MELNGKNNLNGNGKCKICRSPYRESIDRMILEGKSSTEIIEKFKDKIPNLNKVNIHNHRKHIPVLAEAQKKYQRYIEEKSNEAVDALIALDKTIVKAFHNLMSFNPETQPRKVEVWANTMFKAIKLKHEIQEQEDPGRKLADALVSLIQEPDIEEVEA
ncbi:MAG: hypothetical protein J7K36_09295 [Archaeoglobaceae archaeon]|nr:hypothetical protein [Archaeoglobaceae archaeon]